MTSDARRQLIRDYLAVESRRTRRTLEYTAIRMQSLGALDLLAESVSEGQVTSAATLCQIISEESPELNSMSPERIAQFCRALALIQRDDDNAAVAAKGLIWVFNRTPDPLHHDFQRLLAYLLIRTNQREHLESLLPRMEFKPSEQPFIDLEVDRLRELSRRPPVHGGWKNQFCALAGISFPEGFEPSSFEDLNSHDANFDRIESHNLVSIIMPSYNPGPEIFMAIESILRQTWQNLELLVVNDGSADEFLQTYAAVEALDPRIRVIHAESNQGTYAARNLGLLHAQGVYIGFQDTDDWSHPQRVEKQIALLDKRPELVATLSKGIRLGADLSVYMPHGRPASISVAASLLFRTFPVHYRLGFFDTVRKAADSELLERIRTVFGRSSIRAVDEYLYLVQATENSLSRGDFLSGWRHPNRDVYVSLYSSWHKSISQGHSDPFVEPHIRRFNAPSAYLRSRTDEADFDVVLVGDWHKSGGPQQSMFAEVKELARMGLKVGICHLHALRFMSTQHSTIGQLGQELLEKRLAEYVVLDQKLRAKLVILRYPPILQFTESVPSNWAVDSLWILANQAPCELDGSDLRYIPADCSAEARIIWSSEPLWVPQGPQVRSMLESMKTGILLSEFDSPGFVRFNQWKAERKSFADRRVVVGRHSRDDDMKFPSSPAQMLEVYDLPGRDIQFLGGERTVSKIFDNRPFPPNWVIHPTHSIPVREFLASLDFYVFFPNEIATEAFGRAILEAIASGCLVILPHSFEATFGDAAIYCLPNEVEQTIDRFVENPTMYAEQIEKATAYAEKHFSEKAFRELMANEANLKPRKKKQSVAG